MDKALIITIIVAVVAAAAIGAVCFILGGIHRKRVAEKAIGDANEEAKRIINAALSTAEAKKRELLIEAKDEIHRERTENEKEIKDRRVEVQRSERRLIQKKNHSTGNLTHSKRKRTPFKSVSRKRTQGSQRSKA